MKKVLLLLWLSLITASCGTLGHIVFYEFQYPKKDVEQDLLKIIKSNLHKVPGKWSYAAVGYDSLDEKFIYFSNSPEEMFEVSFTGDKLKWDSTRSCELGLVGVFQGDKWKFEEDMGGKEKKRIQQRFENEILSKIKYNYDKSD